MADDQLDLVSRDPNGVNAHLGTLLFNDVLGEPDGTHSIDCVWKLSYMCFECWKGLCYKLLTLFCGICIAAEWGCEFAYIAFYHSYQLSIGNRRQEDFLVYEKCRRFPIPNYLSITILYI
ncbi:Caveolin-3 [Mizuhopecten yessoensis]|uniref:Caveolin n=1 Tax=Mizuhopecten yessoensis TaxID=6573 RepID=A0A210QWY3_MIZYE|nr:Caveolin-3 [Mizuhopecten yessoensis]